MNYYKEISKMLGVEPGEEFKIKRKGDAKAAKQKFCFTEEGLITPNADHNCILDFLNILEGKAEIVKLPWKPKTGRSYWYYSPCDETAHRGNWTGGYHDLLYWKAGNCFETREEAITKGGENIKAIRKEFEEA